MQITEEQLRERLANPDNLANCIKNGRIVRNATIVNGGLPGAEKEEKESISSTEQSECFGALSTGSDRITHRELKRPGNCRPWLSSTERTRIAISAATDRGKTQEEIAEENNVRVSTVSDIANNVRRMPNTERSVNQAKVDQALDEVREAAIDKLMAGLGLLTTDKISAHNAKDISAICANMAKVVQQTIPEKNVPQSINLVVYTPELRQEKNFNVIEI